MHDYFLKSKKSNKPKRPYPNPTVIAAVSTMAENNADQYIMGAHEAEVKRLTLQHEVMTESTGKLVFSPVDLSSASGLKVLDSATADGRF